MSTFNENLCYLAPCLDLKRWLHQQLTNNHGSADFENNITGPKLFEFDTLNSRAEIWARSTKERWRTYYNFLPHITALDKSRLLEAWLVFHQACRQHGIAYFLIEGSLLGAFRHRGIIPWDDGIIVCVDVHDLDRLRNVLSCVAGYTLYVQNNMKWKFFPDDGINTSLNAKSRHNKTFSTAKEIAEYKPEWEHPERVILRFPFLDIFFTKSSGGITKALNKGITRHIYFNSSDIYPLTEAPFEGYKASVPCKSRRLLDIRYNLSVCVSSAYNRKKMKAVSSIYRAPCRDMTQMYPMDGV